MPSSKKSTSSESLMNSEASSSRRKKTPKSASHITPPPTTTPTSFLKDLEENLAVVVEPSELENWIIDTARAFQFLEEYAAFWESSKIAVANELCVRLEKFLLSFIKDNASWTTKDNVRDTAMKIRSALDLYKPIIDIFDGPPVSIYRRLEFFHRNLFRIYQYNSEKKVGELLDTLVDVLELWFLKERPDGYKLMANCVVYLLCKPKLTASLFKRLLSWGNYFDCFKRPWTKKKDALPAKKYFADLGKNEWEDDDESSEASAEPAATEPVLAVEKVEYLCDALYKLFSRPEAISSSEGRKFLTMLTILHRDFMDLARLGIDDVMLKEKSPKPLEQLMDVVLNAWTILNKEENPLKLDLEALVITDLMKRAIITDPKQKNNYLNKYQMMVAYMYNENDSAIRRMFHSNLDLMVLDGCKSDNRIVHSNALHLLGLCFPLISPDELRVDRDVMVRDQVDVVIQDMRCIFPAFRAAASEAAGEMLNRGWITIPLTERISVLRGLTDNFFDATTVAVRVNAVKAIGRIIDNQVARPSLVPVLIQMKEVSTDESVPVRMEYYRVLWQAVQQDMLALENGSQIVDADKLLVHYTEKQHPYEAEIGKILDYMVWNTNNMAAFLKNALKLFRNNAAVAVKFFHSVPKKKSAEDIRDVLDAIFSQLFIAFSCLEKKKDDPPGAVFHSKNPEHLNTGLELGGIIMASTVLILHQNPEYNAEIQQKATAVLKVATRFTDIVKTINLYRIACRVPEDQVEHYRTWCMEELESIGESSEPDDTDWADYGIALMTFIHTWGHTGDLLGVAQSWILTEQQKAAPKKGRAKKPAEGGVLRAHLGILYVSMLLSDTDTSGIFQALEAEVDELVSTAANAFKDFLPRRLSKERSPHYPFRDVFYTNVITLMSLAWIHGVRYKKDQSALRKQFQEVLLVVKDSVWEVLGLRNSANLVHTIEAYKNEGKGLLAHKPVFEGHHEIVKIADRIMLTIQSVLKQFGNLISTEDPEMHMLLHGYAPGGAPAQVTLLTPSTGEGVSFDAVDATTSEKRSVRAKRGKK